jgi:hypothetical protein
MNPLRRLVRRSRRERGRTQANELLTVCRPLDALPAAAHLRVKRRLETEVAQSVPKVNPWLKPVVAGIAMLACGTASGIVIDRLVLNRQSALSAETATGAAAQRTARGKGKGSRGQLIGNEKDLELGISDETSAVSPPLPLPKETPLLPAMESDASHGEGFLLASKDGPGRAGGIAHQKNDVRAPLKRLAMRAVDATDETTELNADLRPASQGGAHASFDLVPPPPPMFAPSAVPPAPTPAAVSPTMIPHAMVPAPLAPPASQPVAPSGLSEERLLAMAVRAMRTEKDARSALGTLDEYERHYPRGRFSAEADILRIDALTAVNRREDALIALDGLDLSHIPGALERHLQRAELRKRVGRWSEARSDFDWVLSHGPEHDLFERALWGKVECEQKEGRLGEARVEAASYLHRFPRGQFAAQASQLLMTDR